MTDAAISAPARSNPAPLTPSATEDQEPKGRPTSERAKNETAAKP